MKEFGLQKLKTDFSEEISAASKSKPTGGGGESLRHKKMKSFLAKNPSILGLDAAFIQGQTEVPLPSGDSLDILFQRKSKNKDIKIAVEVKTAISPPGDIGRGIFQCIKYKAVMNAEALAKGTNSDIRVILALEATIPSKNLIGMKNKLGVEVIENIPSTK